MIAQPPPIPRPQNEFSRLIGVLVSPVATFADVARRPRWWIPMIVLAIVTTVFLGLFSRRIGWEAVTRQAIERNANTQDMPVAQREQIIARGTAVAQYVGYVGGVVGPAFFMLITSAVLIFVTDSLMGAEIGFPRMMGIVGYSSMPGVLYTGLAILVMFLKSPDDFDLNNPLAFNVGAFLPDGSARWLVVLASSLDLFSFWRIGLMATGISVAAPKIRFGKALGAVVFLWLIYVALRTASAATFGG